MIRYLVLSSVLFTNLAYADIECHRNRDGDIYYLHQNDSDKFKADQELKDRKLFKAASTVLQFNRAQGPDRDAYAFKVYGRSNPSQSEFRYQSNDYDVLNALGEQKEGRFIAQFVDFISSKDGVCDIRLVSGWNKQYQDFIVNENPGYLSWKIPGKSTYIYLFKIPSKAKLKVVEAKDLLSK